MEKTSKHFKNIYEGEHMIGELIRKTSQCSVHFEYEPSTTNSQDVKLNLVTYNLKHKTHFLLHSISIRTMNNTHDNKIICLEKMYDHIYGINEIMSQKNDGSYNGEKCYTIKWSDSEKNGLQTSFFYGKDIEEVIKKFYYGKSTKQYTIFFMSLNSEC